MTIEELQEQNTTLIQQYEELKQQLEIKENVLTSQLSELNNKCSTLESDNESLRKTNMDLFLKVQATYNDDKEIEFKEEPKTTIKNILEGL